MRKLQYANLSLDVIPGATVEEMIQRYFTVSPIRPQTVVLWFVVFSASSNSACFVVFSQEEDVVFRCEWCEGSRSVLSSSLESLPR